MKKINLAATLVVLFLTVGANVKAANVENVNETVIDVIMNLDKNVAEKFVPMYQKLIVDIESVSKSDKFDDSQKAAKIENLKNWYSDKFCYLLDTDQNNVVINNIPFDYINGRIAK